MSGGRGTSERVPLTPPPALSALHRHSPPTPDASKPRSFAGLTPVTGFRTLCDTPLCSSANQWRQHNSRARRALAPLPFRPSPHFPVAAAVSFLAQESLLIVCQPRALLSPSSPLSVRLRPQPPSWGATLTFDLINCAYVCVCACVCAHAHACLDGFRFRSLV